MGLIQKRIAYAGVPMASCSLNPCCIQRTAKEEHHTEGTEGTEVRSKIDQKSKPYRRGLSAESAAEYLCARLLVTQFFHRACSALALFLNDPGPCSCLAAQAIILMRLRRQS